MESNLLRPPVSARVPTALVLLSFLNVSACAYHARSTQAAPPSKAQLRELWDPSVVVERRNLLNGPGGPNSVARGTPHFRYVKTDTSGASPGYTVMDARGVEWDVKLGPEAPVEVVVSRLVWATGFHQLPTYYVSNWTLENGPRPGPQAAGRFRPKLPEARRVDDWAWPKNPFVGTRELRGLFVLMVILNNWDLKTSQNAVYEVRRGAQRQRQYVVQDLGASLGGTRWFFPGTKGDVEDYEREPLVSRVRNGLVQFHYRGAWREPALDDDIRVSDVRWICGLLNRLTDQQLADAFRAGGYDARHASRFIRVLRSRVRDGLNLPSVRAAAE
jgi:hypothetical protein